jgi:hypothetical protein
VQVSALAAGSASGGGLEVRDGRCSLLKCFEALQFCRLGLRIKNLIMEMNFQCPLLGYSWMCGLQ